ncbi:MAG: hypothetical protein P8Y61_05815 [Gammaproteobacteria bacterium]|jgi:hypothetical protein
METVTHEDIARLFPGIQDHAAVEILGTSPTLAELEAAALLLQNADEGLIDAKRKHGDRLNRLLEILDNAGVQQGEDDRD